MYYTHFVLQVVTVYGHQCWSRRSVSRWWWKVNYADVYNFWHFGDLADFLDAMTTVLMKLQLWLYQLCRHWWRMSAHFLLAFSTLFSHPYWKQQRYMFITHLYLLTVPFYGILRICNNAKILHLHIELCCKMKAVCVALSILMTNELIFQFNNRELSNLMELNWLITYWKCLEESSSSLLDGSLLYLLLFTESLQWAVENRLTRLTWSFGMKTQVCPRNDASVGVWFPHGKGHFGVLSPHWNALDCVNSNSLHSTGVQICPQGTAHHGESLASEFTHSCRAWQVQQWCGLSSKFLKPFFCNIFVIVVWYIRVYSHEGLHLWKSCLWEQRQTLKIILPW